MVSLFALMRMILLAFYETILLLFHKIVLSFSAAFCISVTMLYFLSQNSKILSCIFDWILSNIASYFW